MIAAPKHFALYSLRQVRDIGHLVRKKRDMTKCADVTHLLRRNEEGQQKSEKLEERMVTSSSAGTTAAGVEADKVADCEGVFLAQGKEVNDINHLVKRQVDN